MNLYDIRNTVQPLEENVTSGWFHQSSSAVKSWYLVPTFIHIHGVRLLIFCNHVWRTKAGNMDNCKRYGRCKHKLPQFAFSRNPSCPVLHNQLVRPGTAHWLVLSAFNNLRIHLIISNYYMPSALLSIRCIPPQRSRAAIATSFKCRAAAAIWRLPLPLRTSLTFPAAGFLLPAIGWSLSR